MNDNYFIRQGWQCPICERVYSPDTYICIYCNNRNNTYTTTGTDTPSLFPKMKDFSPEEAEEYRKVVKEMFKDTGINIKDLIDK